jgi:head-tail adaptor
VRAFIRAPKDQKLPEIGELRRRITFAVRKRMPDDEAGFIETMTPIKKFWSRVTNLEGVPWAKGASDKDQAYITHEFLIRRWPSYDNQFFDEGYVFYKGIRYDIDSIWEYDHGERFLGLMCYVQNREGGALEQPYFLATEQDALLLDP